MKPTLITAYVFIGKSRIATKYIFHERDFVRIEADMLVIKGEDRVLKLDEENMKQVLFQMNHFEY